MSGSGSKTCPPPAPKPCPPKNLDNKNDGSKNGGIGSNCGIGDGTEKNGGDNGSKKCKEFWTPGFDARFPNQNQTRHCWFSYVDYFRCIEKFGEGHEPCEYYKKAYAALCPEFWIEHWDAQRDSGTFPWPHKP